MVTPPMKVIRVEQLPDERDREVNSIYLIDLGQERLEVAIVGNTPDVVKRVRNDGPRTRSVFIDQHNSREWGYRRGTFIEQNIPGLYLYHVEDLEQESDLTLGDTLQLVVGHLYDSEPIVDVYTLVLNEPRIGLHPGLGGTDDEGVRLFITALPKDWAIHEYCVYNFVYVGDSLVAVEGMTELQEIYDQLSYEASRGVPDIRIINHPYDPQDPLNQYPVGWPEAHPDGKRFFYHNNTSRDITLVSYLGNGRDYHFRVRTLSISLVLQAKETITFYADYNENCYLVDGGTYLARVNTPYNTNTNWGDVGSFGMFYSIISNVIPSPGLNVSGSLLYPACFANTTSGLQVSHQSAIGGGTTWKCLGGMRSSSGTGGGTLASGAEGTICMYVRVS